MSIAAAHALLLLHISLNRTHRSERGIATQYPIHPDMGVKYDHFAQFQSSIGAAEEKMSPSILPLPAIRIEG